ncbi:MAG: Fe(2+) transporter permease subunit FeoB [Oxalobacter sp.]|nr:MAG: Fe(2+) transporter permease subunit FeoB [Oxalobacter sp.]
MKQNFTIGLVGNPNSGKTTLFNALTGSKQRVGNWPGVTVEKKSGELRVDNMQIEIVDLPGIYSLDVVDEATSVDEKIARDTIHSGVATLFVNIVDASNLERNLFLTIQLLEMGVPVVVALNMIDVAESKGLQVNTESLAAQLGCPVVSVVASKEKGLSELKSTVVKAAQNLARPTLRVMYPDPLESAITELSQRLQPLPLASRISPRWLATRLIEGDKLVQQACDPSTVDIAAQYTVTIGEDLDIMVADARYTLANRLANMAVTGKRLVKRDVTDRIDRIVLNRFLGIPIFLLMMYGMFMFTIQLGGAFIDFFEQFVGAFLVDGLTEWLGALGLPQWLTFLLAKGIGGGIQTVATFIPIIGFLYLFLSFLEDSGYMARAAFVMDRFMRWIGLPGKSFVPLIVGFGCNVPAVMATRTLEHRRDRLMAIAMAPFMSCGARLPVYLLFAAAFFPQHAQNAVFALYLMGFAAAIITGLALKRTLLKGEITPFIMELPPYHLPTLKGVLRHTWDRLKSFIFRAGRIIVPMVLVLNVLNSVGTNGSFGNEDSDRSVLASIGRSIAPAFSPLGLTQENWPAAVGIFTGILAKEATVGTLNATYKSLAENSAAADDLEKKEEAFSLAQKVSAAFATIPEKLSEAFGKWRDPVGIVVADLNDPTGAAKELEVSTATFGAMQARFDGAAGAFAYMVFILLYFPCAAAVAAVYQESGVRWTIFVSLWTTGLAYGIATLCYQLATFSAHPVQSLFWLGLVSAAFATTLFVMRRMGQAEVALLHPEPQRA